MDRKALMDRVNFEKKFKCVVLFAIVKGFDNCEEGIMAYFNYRGKGLTHQKDSGIFCTWFSNKLEH